MPSERNEDRQRAKRDADMAADYCDRLIARGYSRKEAIDLTAAWVLGRVAESPDEEERDTPEWLR